jgi:hypothetical protein
LKQKEIIERSLNIKHIGRTAGICSHLLWHLHQYCVLSDDGERSLQKVAVTLGRKSANVVAVSVNL